MILHHYELSPYAEKIRLMLGHTRTSWQSVLSPEQPPRPNVDPLSGGYRRIPIAQIGADVFCDTFIIAQEIATLARAPELDPEQAPENAAEIVARAEGEVFFAAIGSVSPLTLVGTMLSQFGLLGTLRFAFDRGRMMQGAKVNPPQGEAAKVVMRDFLEELDRRLADQDYLTGSSPSVADFSAYHPLWLYVSSSRGPFDQRFGNVTRWYERVSAIGHGLREESTAQDAFVAAKSAEPRPLPPDSNEPDRRIGSQVSVAPSDYGTVPVIGTLVAVTASRCIVERDTEQFGTLHVHFPVRGYEINNAGAQRVT